MNKLFQIVEKSEQLNHAGTKATADFVFIAEQLGFKSVPIRMISTNKTRIGKIERQAGYLRDWHEAKKEVREESVLLLQHPFHHKQLTREKSLCHMKKKGVKVISVVHDVEKLRAFRYNEYYRKEFRFMLEIADVIIVHNSIMKEWFVQQGIPENRLISLEVFDYIQNTPNPDDCIFEKSITIAGNLDTTKCGYISHLSDLKKTKIHLYGPNYDEKLSRFENIEYHGSLPSEEITKVLRSGFGLVWDGSSIEGCIGQSGQYLRYNNPHKLSLYLSSGMPVVLWKKAAEADFVRRHRVGILVDNLSEMESIIDSCSEEEYTKMSVATNLLKKRLTTGYYGEKALRKALDLIQKQT